MKSHIEKGGVLRTCQSASRKAALEHIHDHNRFRLLCCFSCGFRLTGRGRSALLLERKEVLRFAADFADELLHRIAITVKKIDREAIATLLEKDPVRDVFP